MSVTDDLTQVATDLTTAQTAVSQAVADLSTPAVPSVGDAVLEAIIPVLTSAGYTVTAPEAESSSEDTSETSEES